MRKILAAHRYYYPDVSPYSHFLKKILEHYAKDGCDVTVLTSQPSYKKDYKIPKQLSDEKINSVRVKRLNLSYEKNNFFLRVLNSIILGINIFVNSLLSKYDNIIVSTYPPVILAFFASVASKMTGAKLIYHCMDLQPEIGKISGEFNNKLLFKLLETIDSWSCHQAHKIVVLSSDMKKALEERNIAKDKIYVINNFSLGTNAKHMEPLNINYPKEKFKIIFAGNVGRYQGLDSFLDIMTLLKGNDDIQGFILGEGVEKERYKRLCKKIDLNIHFIPHQSIEVASKLISMSQLGFVSLENEVYKYAYPSKIITYLSLSCPLLVSIEENSEIHKTVNDNKLGIAFYKKSIYKAVEFIKLLKENSKLNSQYKSNIKNYFYEHFSDEKILTKWKEII